MSHLEVETITRPGPTSGTVVTTETTRRSDPDAIRTITKKSDGSTEVGRIFRRGSGRAPVVDQVVPATTRGGINEMVNVDSFIQQQSEFIRNANAFFARFGPGTPPPAPAPGSDNESGSGGLLANVPPAVAIGGAAIAAYFLLR